jgi:hypothetical protein
MQRAESIPTNKFVAFCDDLVHGMSQKLLHGPEMEIVVIDGSEFVFLDWHLNSLWEKAPEFDVQSSSNWAGYTAKWEIKDGKLWLTDS